MMKNILFVLTVLFMGCSTVSQREGVVKDFSPDGILKAVRSYEHGALNGMTRDYYETGVLKSVTEYQDNRVHGMKNVYHPDGAIWTKEIYYQGKLLSRIEYDEEGLITKQENF